MMKLAVTIAKRKEMKEPRYIKIITRIDLHHAVAACLSYEPVQETSFQSRPATRQSAYIKSTPVNFPMLHPPCLPAVAISTILPAHK